MIGGDSAKDQIRALSNGVSVYLMLYDSGTITPQLLPSQVDIVCGTPGRLDDMISTGKLDLSNVSPHFTTKKPFRI